MGTEMHTVLCVAKSLYLLTVVSCLRALTFPNVLAYWHVVQFGKLRDKGCEESGHAVRAATSVTDCALVYVIHRSVDVGDFDVLLDSFHKKAQRVSLQYKRVTAHKHCAVPEHIPLTHSANVPCAFIEHCHITVCAHVHCTVTELSCHTERLTSNLSEVFDTKQGLKVPPSPPTELEVTLVSCAPHLTNLSSYCSIR